LNPPPSADVAAASRHVLMFDGIVRFGFVVAIISRKSTLPLRQ
jgi:hypothetical protein